MRLFFLIIFASLLLTEAAGQTSFDTASRDLDLLDEISKEGIQDRFLGCADCISKPRAKADSFFKRIPLDEALACSKNESYTVKYYSFLRILSLDDHAAFTYLKDHMPDSTKLDIRGPCMGRTVPFNELLAAEYERFVYFKSRGQTFTIDGRTYWFDRTDRKTGKQQAREWKELAVQYSLTTSFKFLP